MSRARPIRIAIAVAEFNRAITDGLLRCCLGALRSEGVRQRDIQVVWVPGAYELPFAANRLATRRADAVICLGCVIKGDTAHDELISSWAATGIGDVGISSGVPTIFGVLTPKNERQARARARPGPLDRGREAALAALIMVKRIRRGEL